MENNKIKLLIIQCLNCEKYLVAQKEEFSEGQVDCRYCGYSNEFTDIRIKWWDVEIEGYEKPTEDLR